MLGELDRWREKEGKGVGQLCVGSKLCKVDWIEGRKEREWGNCVLTADCVSCEGSRKKCIQLVLFMANSVCRTLKTKIIHTQTFLFTAV